MTTFHLSTTVYHDGSHEGPRHRVCRCLIEDDFYFARLAWFDSISGAFALYAFARATNITDDKNAVTSISEREHTFQQSRRADLAEIMGPVLKMNFRSLLRHEACDATGKHDYK